VPINFLPLPAPPYQFSQDIANWSENQILIPDWTYFHCPGATQLPCRQKIKIVHTNRQPNLRGTDTTLTTDREMISFQTKS